VINRRPRVVSNALHVLGGLAVLLSVCGAVASAVPDAPASPPASHAQPVDPAANVWLIFIDDLHLDFTATGHLKDLFKKVTTELVHEGDVFGVVSTGPSSIAIDLTRDREQLTRALRQMAGAALKPSEILQPQATLFTSIGMCSFWCLSRCLTLVAVALVLQLEAGAPVRAQEDPLVALQKAEATWARSKPKTYQFTVEVRCFCTLAGPRRSRFFRTRASACGNDRTLSLPPAP